MTVVRGGLPPAVRTYAAIVLLNYAAQAVYAADLYGIRINLAGAALLLATFAWFVVAVVACLRRSRGAYLLLALYALTQFGFYLVVEVGLAFAGYGMLYQLTHAHDAIVWAVFLVGDVSFVASAAILVHLTLRWVRGRERATFH